LDKALEKKRGVMFLVSHLGPMGCVPAALGSRGYDITMTGTPMHHPYFEKKLRQMLAHAPAHRAIIGDNLPQRAREAFARNGIFSTYVDYSVGEKHAVWLPFGQAELLANIAGAIIALRQRVPVFFVRCERRAKQEFEVELTELTTDFESTSDVRSRAVQLVRQTIDLLAPDVRQRPEQWWPWFIADIRPRQPKIEDSFITKKA